MDIQTTAIETEDLNMASHRFQHVYNGLGLSVRRNRVYFGRDKFTGYGLRHSFNEGKELITTTDEYRRKFGCYPEAILVDRICQTQENLQLFFTI